MKHNLICQDSHRISCLDEGVCVAAVADGLGSEIHSDIASCIAAETSVNICRETITRESTEEQIIDVIRLAFNSSLKAIEKRVKEEGGDIEQYDTTLSLCVLYDGCLYYGHSGDSGIIALGVDGKYYNVTKQQRDDEGRVFPLCFGEQYWIIKKFDKAVSSVMLATDGIYELFFPVYLKEKEVNIYTALAKFFMGPFDDDILNDEFEKVIESRELYIDKLPEQVVDDDKTLVALIDDSIETMLQDKQYYQEPDWNVLIREFKDEYNKKAYKKQNNSECIDHEDD